MSHPPLPPIAPSNPECLLPRACAVLPTICVSLPPACALSTDPWLHSIHHTATSFLSVKACVCGWGDLGGSGGGGSKMAAAVLAMAAKAQAELARAHQQQSVLPTAATSPGTPASPPRVLLLAIPSVPTGRRLLLLYCSARLCMMSGQSVVFQCIAHDRTTTLPRYHTDLSATILCYNILHVDGYAERGICRVMIAGCVELAHRVRARRGGQRHQRRSSRRRGASQQRRPRPPPRPHRYKDIPAISDAIRLFLAFLPSSSLSSILRNSYRYVVFLTVGCAVQIASMEAAVAAVDQELRLSEGVPSGEEQEGGSSSQGGSGQQLARP
eukprot:COSAG05_NODE_628_length_8241_cov_5.614468_8_plen_326_part_00